ncbi:DUF1861 family protein [Dactylosporangium aurantiacum]|uniref:DUF1861 family protein n=1 Tax=Dactylosporangium aurantiacum TaxID=35754 RepID=A0A9Q9IML8_9ACTN|nr:DUF1861 family protein [Dactylosporangium aurantiacum]MDG6103235.1 DUF1861 family protein [Dactylosporangium aurantiacum]UWZ57738.1 DUF1861 family protein [Dactylosporangium aurantiacum]
MTPPATGYRALVAEHLRRPDRPSGVAEVIPDVGDRLAYNPCVVRQGTRTLLAVRVESPDSYWRDAASWDPQIRFYERTAGGWRPAPGTPVFTAAEDPFAAWVRGRDGEPVLVFGVVSLDFRHDPPRVVTRFHAAPDVERLDPADPFVEVPDMKDIRLLQRPDGLAICGRPQGGTAGRGRVSLIMADDYTELSAELVAKAHVFHDQVAEDTKLGVNELYDLGDRIGVLGHIAVGEEGGPQEYAGACWTIDPAARTTTTPRVIVMRSDFPPAPPKRADLTDVVFPGSMEPLDGDLVRIHCGLSDASLGSIVMPSPFPTP